VATAARSKRDTGDVFFAVADPTRRGLLDLLAGGERPVKGLAEPFGMSRPAVSQHLKVLRKAGLVSERRSGRERIYRLEPAPLEEVRDWVETYERFWRGRLGALGRHLDEVP
jgi:DNA-binding transcriptional ArsR family regulator